MFWRWFSKFLAPLPWSLPSDQCPSSVNTYLSNIVIQFKSLPLPGQPKGGALLCVWTWDNFAKFLSLWRSSDCYGAEAPFKPSSLPYPAAVHIPVLLLSLIPLSDHLFLPWGTWRPPLSWFVSNLFLKSSPEQINSVIGYFSWEPRSLAWWGLHIFHLGWTKCPWCVSKLASSAASTVNRITLFLSAIFI